MFFKLLLILSSYVTEISEEINQNSLKWQVYQILQEVKLLVLIW